ncbi:hypothetical protein UPYG_G00136970 [Umbra pygmaea]|uniref:C2 domain-containing protein n=1 Tax=Umbra pygmaea TaxID=75934 RepID=A0ABD0WUE1_UMBPY
MVNITIGKELEGLTTTTKNMAYSTLLLAVGLSLGSFLLLLIGVYIYFLWRRKGQKQCKEYVSTTTLPSCTTPILLTQRSRNGPDEIPFLLPPRLKSSPRKREREEKKMGGMELINTHRGSLTVESWYPVGTLREDLYWVPDVSDASPRPDRAVQLCFSVAFRHDNEQLLITLLHLSNFPACFHGNVTLAELRLLPDNRRRHQAKARCEGCNLEFNDSFVFQVSSVCVSQCVLSVCVLSVDQGGGRHTVGRVLFPLEGQLGEGGRLLWKDLETSYNNQFSELGEMQVSLNYCPSLQRLTVARLKARGLQSHTDTGVYFQVSLHIHSQLIKSQRTPVVSGEAEPDFSNKMTFKLRPSQVDKACLCLELFGQGPAPIGVVMLGPLMYARGPQLHHWTDMLNTPNELVKQWHGLGRPT